MSWTPHALLTIITHIVMIFTSLYDSIVWSCFQINVFPWLLMLPTQIANLWKKRRDFSVQSTIASLSCNNPLRSPQTQYKINALKPNLKSSNKLSFPVGKVENVVGIIARWLLPLESFDHGTTHLIMKSLCNFQGPWNEINVLSDSGKCVMWAAVSGFAFGRSLWAHVMGPSSSFQLLSPPGHVWESCKTAVWRPLF